MPPCKSRTAKNQKPTPGTQVAKPDIAPEKLAQIYAAIEAYRAGRRSQPVEGAAPDFNPAVIDGLTAAVITGDPTTDGILFQMRMENATGSVRWPAVSDTVSLLGAVVFPKGKVAGNRAVEYSALTSALAHMLEIAPRDGVEGMLAAQMVAAYRCAMMELANSTQPDQDVDLRTVRVNRAARLMRLFSSQIETLSKYRSRGEQKILVQHVHVNVGGQAAVVGNVTNGQGGGG